MIYGRYPFVSRVTGDLREMAADLYHQILTTQPSFIGRNISQNLRDLFIRIFEKNPHKRITLPQILVHPWLAPYMKKNNSVNVNFPPGYKKSRCMENVISEEKIHEKISEIVQDKISERVNEKRASDMVLENRGSDPMVREVLSDMPIPKRSSDPAVPSMKPKNRKEHGKGNAREGRREVYSLCRGQSCVF